MGTLWHRRPPRRKIQPKDADPQPSQSSRLPLRWAVIGLAAGLAGAACFGVGGPVAAILVATAVATLLNAILD